MLRAERKLVMFVPRQNTRYHEFRIPSNRQASSTSSEQKTEPPGVWCLKSFEQLCNSLGPWYSLRIRRQERARPFSGAGETIVAEVIGSRQVGLVFIVLAQ